MTAPCRFRARSVLAVIWFAINVAVVPNTFADLDPVLVSQAENAPVHWDYSDFSSLRPHLSADGRTAVFSSSATNLIPGDDRTAIHKAFVWNADTDQLTELGPSDERLLVKSVSADGQWVIATDSGYRGLLHLLNRTTGEYRSLSIHADIAIISPDAKRVAVVTAGSRSQLLVLDLDTNTATDISPSRFSSGHSLQFSRDGRYLAYIARTRTRSTGSRDQAFLHDFATGEDQLLTEDPERETWAISINADASLVLLSTAITDLVPEAPVEPGGHLVLLNRTSNTYDYLYLLSKNENSFYDDNYAGRISADGQRIHFNAAVPQLPAESVGTSDEFSSRFVSNVYFLDRVTGTLTIFDELDAGYVTTSSQSSDGQIVGLRGSRDVYVYSVDAGVANRISKINGDPVAWGANGPSHTPAISSNGDVVVFGSTAFNLVGDDLDGRGYDLFAYSRELAENELVSVTAPANTSGGGHHAVSGNGRFVAHSNPGYDLRIYDRTTQTEQVVVPTRTVGPLSFSDDGRYLVYKASLEADVGEGVYVYDQDQDSVFELAPAADADLTNAQISGDGQVVLFRSSAKNLVANYPRPEVTREENFVWERSTNSIELLLPDGSEFIKDPDMNGNGRFIVFDTDQCYLLDRTVNVISAVSQGSAVNCPGPQISDNARYILVSASADKSIYVHDRVTATTVQVLPAGEFRTLQSVDAVISSDGSKIALSSTQETLTPDGNNIRDVFLMNNPLFDPADNGELFQFTATRRPGTRIVDISATWPPEAQWTQVSEQRVPGGVLWDGPDKTWQGTYVVPPGSNSISLNSRYWVAGAEFGNAELVLEIDASPAEPEPNRFVVEGFAWLDADGDSFRGDTEAAEAGREVTLYRCAAPWGIAGSATTLAPLGTFEITDIAAGMYQIGTPGTGVEFSPPANDNIVYPNGFSNCFDVNGSQPLAGIGLISSADERVTLSGFAWLDSSIDGRRDEGELPDVNRQVTAYRCAPPWGIAGVASTDSNGRFAITDVAMGQYQFGISAAGVRIAPLGNDNNLYPNGFTNCKSSDASAPMVGLGVVP